MARGWESKGVEEQQAGRADAQPAPAASEAGKQRAREQVIRQRQSLELQREQVLNQRTSNPHRREALAAALAYIEGQLAALDAPP